MLCIPLDQCRVPTRSELLLLPMGISNGVQRARLSPQRPPRAGDWLLPFWKGFEDTQDLCRPLLFAHLVE